MPAQVILLSSKARVLPGWCCVPEGRPGPDLLPLVRREGLLALWTAPAFRASPTRSCAIPAPLRRVFRSICLRGPESRQGEPVSVSFRLLKRRCGPLSDATTTPRSKTLSLELLEALADALLDFQCLTTWLAAKALCAPGGLPTEPPAPAPLAAPIPLPHFPIHHLAPPLQKLLAPLRSQEPAAQLIRHTARQQ